jgi:putative membrane-bound dehydrogenase-like protein
MKSISARTSIHILAVSIATILPLHAGPDKPETRAVATTKLVHDEPVAVRAELQGAKELYLVATDGGDGIQADWANWIEPVLIKADGSKVKLTDLKPKETKLGWGELGVNLTADGKEQMRMKGQPVAFGFGAHAPSMLAFDLPEGVVAFESRAGIDDSGLKQGTGGTAVFQVYTQRPPGTALAVGEVKNVSKGYGTAAAVENMKTFTAAEGLAASLVAAEPTIQNPTNIDVDHRGRLWAVEAVNYRTTMQKWGIIRPEGDRVVILEDKDGDGLADTEKTFYQNKDLTAPLGILVLPQAKGTQVIVSAAPNVWLLTDTDGDDKADKVDKLFTVGGNWDHDHQVHAFVFGPDGKFYFNFGNEGRDLKWPDGTIVKDLAGNDVTDKGKPYRQGLVFRCDIVDGKAANVETLGHNFRNNYEVAVDSFGTMWQSDNDDDGNQAVRINYVMDYGNYGFTDELTGAGWQTKRTNMEVGKPLQHWHLNDPGVVPNLLQTGSGSPTGILVNEGTLLGKTFQNELIHCDAGPRKVRAYPVKIDGAGYSATMVDILTSKDEWYRPSDVAIAPDGSLIVSDWYDPGVGGHNMGDHEKEKIRGRIYRVAPPAAKASVPPVSVATPAEAVAALKSPNQATQYIAWQRLHAFGAEAESELLKLWKDENPRLRSRALFLLAQIKGRENQHLTAGLTDADPQIRTATVRLIRALTKTRGLDSSVLESNQALVAKLVKDPSAQVRREIALSLHGAKEIAPMWAALAQQHDGKDRWYLEALGIGAAGQEEACFSAWLAAVGDQWNTPAGRDIIWRLRSSASAAYLAKILTDKATTPADQPRYLRAFDFLPANPEKNKVLIELASLGAQSNFIATEALQRLKSVDVNTTPELKSAIDSMLVATKGTPQFIELVRDFKVKGRGAALLEIAAKNPKAATSNEALKLLLSEDDAAQVIQAALGTDQAGGTIDALGATGDKRAIAVLLPLLTDANRQANLRPQAVRALALSAPGAEALLGLARDGKFPNELKLAATSALHAVQIPALKAEVAKLFPAPNALGGQPLAPIAELVKINGDVNRGKELTAKAETSCVTCHRIGNVGVDFGPALTEIGSKLGKEAMFEAIIEPNAGVSMGFETTQLETKDGNMAIGIVSSETNDELTLTMPQGITNKFKKSDVTKREKMPTSMMPSGINQALTQQDLVDVVEYLVSLKKP